MKVGVIIKLEFVNGSKIETIETNESNTRSKRVEEYIRQYKFYNEHPYEYIQMCMGDSFKTLKWWQKMYIKVMCKLKR